MKQIISIAFISILCVCFAGQACAQSALGNAIKKSKTVNTTTKSKKTTPAKAVNSNRTQPSSTKQPVVKNDFETIISSSKPTIVDFYATWCGPCKVQEPIMEEVATYFGDKINVMKIDVDKNATLAQRYGLQAVPTVMIFKDGKAVWTAMGVQNKDVLVSKLNECLGVKAYAKTYSDSVYVDTMANRAPKPEPQDNRVFSAPEVNPAFPGGQGALMRWVASNLRYPAVAAEAGIQGRVVVTFIVDKNGHPTDVKVIRGIHPALDAEAIRLVKSMPKWTPGTVNGTPVNCTFSLPITFRLT